MTDIQKICLLEAVKRYGKITPIMGAKNIENSFTIEEDQILFWFFLRNHKVRTVIKPLPPKERGIKRVPLFGK